MAEEKRRGLGRGLSALLGDPVDLETPVALAEAGEGAPRNGVRSMPVDYLQAGKYQPRTMFREDELNDLVESIREKGILQPILVREVGANRYEIIAGERRWRAAQRAGLHEVPALVREFSDKEAAEVALIENLQRQDLSPLEEAEGYRRLMDEFANTQEDLARAVGKSRSHVANMMRLLALPDPVKGMLEQGELTMGHARALLTASDAESLAKQVVAKGLNVRQTEKLAQQQPGKSPKPKAAAPEKDADTLALERDLSNLLGLKVVMNFKGRGGELVIHYDNLEQLDSILHRLSAGAEVAELSGLEDEDEDQDSLDAAALAELDDLLGDQ